MNVTHMLKWFLPDPRIDKSLLPRIARLESKPKKTTFYRDNSIDGSWAIKLINYTHCHIYVSSFGWIDVNGGAVYLDGKIFTINYDCKVVAYRLKYYPRLFCFDLKKKEGLQNRFFIEDLGKRPYQHQLVSDTTDIINTASEKALQRHIFTVILAGFKDEGSFFYKIGFPKDIIKYIAVLYDAIIHHNLRK